MKTSMATVSIAGDLSEKFAAIAAAGFDAVEIFENDFLAFDGSARDVARMARDAGLAISLFQPFRDFEGLPEPQRSRAFDRAERKFDVMQELGTDLMLICSSVSPVALGGIDRAAADLHALGERAARRGLRVGFEALAWGRHINDHRDAWEVVRRADHASVGLILDSFHTLSRKIDLNSIRAIPGDKIFMVHIADAPMLDMDLLYWSRHFRNMPGEGDLPVRDFMRAVASTSYDGYLSLEIFNDQFRGGSPRAISVDGHRSLVWLMDQVRREEPALPVDLPTMPDRVGVQGVSFVEIAANKASMNDLSTLLTTLGFDIVGRHRTKDVTVFRQGDINILVNTDDSGFARSSFLVHGVSAYAFALKVDDADAVMRRAKALDAEIFVQAVGPGELVIPAVHGPGGGLIFFIDDKTSLGRLWDIDFLPAPTPAQSNDVGLRSIDHVGQTMPQEDLPSWLLFYLALLQTTKTPIVDVVDPAGLIRSQVVEGVDKRLRLTLNGAQGKSTLAGRFISDTSGAGVQHLAFATDDIFATLEKLVARGFEPLRISPNYFDDVEARFGLDPELADRLRAGNVLYDRDGSGEFFQVYVPAFPGGMIVEILQRKGGYAGYGAPNAAFRIAAQRRLMRPKGMPSVGASA